MMIVKVICKECYIKKYGKIPVGAIWYRETDEQMECEDCGKKDYVIYTTERVDPKNYELKFK